MLSLELRRVVFIFLLVLATSALSFAQTPSPTATPKISEDDTVVKVSSRLVVVPVSVTDASGQPVPGLKIDDFRIAEEGRQQKLDSVGTADKVPLEIVLLFDVSASTDAMFKFEQDTAAAFLKDVMRPEDRATIFSIGQKSQLVQGRDTADQSVASISTIAATKGATAFFDTMRDAAEYLRKNSPTGRRRVVVVISDGEDNFSEAVQRAYREKESKIAAGDDPDFKKTGSIVAQAQQTVKMRERARVLRALQNADTVFYSINPAGSSYYLNTISVFGQENMQQFADQTGGSAFLPKFQPIDTKDTLTNVSNTRKNKATLELIFRQLANELRAQYLVQYYSESEFPLNKYVKLDVGLNNRGPLRLRARQGYFVKE